MRIGKSLLLVRAMRMVTRERPPRVFRRGRAAYGSTAAIIDPKGPRSRSLARVISRETSLIRGRAGRPGGSIVPPSPYGPRMPIEIRADVAAHRRPRRTGAQGNATTELSDQAVSPPPPPDLSREVGPHRAGQGPRLGRVGRAGRGAAAGAEAEPQAPLRAHAVLQPSLLRRPRDLGGRGQRREVDARGGRLDPGRGPVRLGHDRADRPDGSDGPDRSGRAGHRADRPGRRRRRRRAGGERCADRAGSGADRAACRGTDLPSDARLAHGRVELAGLRSQAGRDLAHACRAPEREADPPAGLAQAQGSQGAQGSGSRSRGARSRRRDRLAESRGSRSDAACRPAPARVRA